MSMSRRTLLLAGAAVGLVGVEITGSTPVVFVDAEFAEVLHHAVRFNGAAHPPLRILVHCRDLDFVGLKDAMLSTGHFAGVLQSSTHLLVLEAARDLFARVLLDRPLEELRPEDSGAELMALAAAAARIRPGLRAVAIRCG